MSKKTSIIAEVKLDREFTSHVIREARRWPWWGGAIATGPNEPHTRIYVNDDSEDLPEDEAPPPRQIDWARGLQMLVTGQHKIDLGCFDVEDGGRDDDADRFLQLCVFGEVIYG